MADDTKHNTNGNSKRVAKYSREIARRLGKREAVQEQILNEVSSMPELAIGAMCHHEKYNCTGYPDGLKGEEISEAARIMIDMIDDDSDFTMNEHGNLSSIRG